MNLLAEWYVGTLAFLIIVVFQFLELWLPERHMGFRFRLEWRGRSP